MKEQIAETPIRVIDHPKHGIRLNFRTTQDQVYFNAWEGRDTIARFMGKCVVCGRNVYSPVGNLGVTYDPDPRGIFIQEHAAAHLVAIEYGMTGPDVPMCFACSNTQSEYNKGLQIARGQWKEAK